MIVIIPAKRNSSRVPGKNFKDFCGKPLIEWAIEKALKIENVSKIIVSTNNTKYNYKHPRIVIDYRPERLARDNTPIDNVFEYLEEKYDLEGSILLLEPPNPLCSLEHIREGIKIHLKTGNSVISANRYTYEPNGGFYIFTLPKKPSIKGLFRGYSVPIELYLMNTWENIEIDEPHHWIIVETLMRERE